MLSEHTRSNILLVLVLLFILEGLSWWTASMQSPCLIQMSDQEQAAHNYSNKDCPTFFVGSLILLGRLDKFIADHDKSIVAGFTIVLAVSTIGLWLSTRKLWAVTDKTLEHAQITTKRQLRAYVMVENANMVKRPDDWWDIAIQIKNFGQTPAYGVATTTEYELSDPKPDDAVLRFTPASEQHAQTIMGPGKVHSIRLQCTKTYCLLSNGEFGFAQMSAAGKRVYVWGRVDYMTFDEHRWLTFQLVCYMGQMLSFGFCEAGNDADDQHRQEYT